MRRPQWALAGAVVALIVVIAVVARTSAADASRRSSNIAAEPAIVCTTRSVATERVSPASTAASTSASTIRKK